MNELIPTILAIIFSGMLITAFVVAIIGIFTATKDFLHK
jgi:hypothetical protein